MNQARLKPHFRFIRYQAVNTPLLLNIDIGKLFLDSDLVVIGLLFYLRHIEYLTSTLPPISKLSTQKRGISNFCIVNQELKHKGETQFLLLQEYRNSIKMSITGEKTVRSTHD